MERAAPRRWKMRARVWLVFGTFLLTAAWGTAAPKLELTPAEHAWIAQHPRIRVGFDPQWAPFSYATSSGELTGIDADVLTTIGQRVGLKFESSTRSDWPAVYEAARARQYDLLTGTARTPEREAEFQFTQPYLSFPLVIITRGGAPLLWTIEDLRNQNVVVPRGYATTLMLKRRLPGIRLRLTSTVDEALKLVSEGDADATLTNLPNVSFVVKTRGYTNLMIAGVAPDSLDLCFAVRPDWPELTSILNKGIALLTPADRQALDHRWIRVDYANVVRWDVVWKSASLVLLIIAIAIGIGIYRNRLLSRELAERVRLHHQIEATHRELKQLHEEKSGLLQMAAHDLRSPLTSIQLTLDTVKMNATPVAAALKLVESQTHAMITLLNEILDLEELEEGRRKLQCAAVPPRPIVDAVLSAHAIAAARKQLHMDLSGLIAVPTVWADAHALRQIFDNLVSNAVKFSPPGHTIRLEWHEWNRQLRFRITNDGPGVSPDEIERIFTKYARGSAKPTAGEKSVGLGLSIVRSLANAMNGRAWCESVPGQNATFIVTLPFEAPGSTPA